ncbi:MAG: site-2 protease family protein [Bacillota bacterium]
MSGLFSGINLMELLYRIPAIVVALSFHEWAHAYSAYRLGDPTARNLGRMTLNPLSHIDPIGFIMLILVRFGWARPVPINPRNFKNQRRDESIVSLAGVFVNLLLAFVTMGIAYVLSYFNVTNVALDTIIYYFYFINIGLLVFNLLPIPPLDGYHVFQNLLIRVVGPKPFLFLDRYGQFVLLGLLLTGALTGLLSVVVEWIASGMAWVYNNLIFFWM